MPACTCRTTTWNMTTHSAGYSRGSLNQQHTQSGEDPWAGKAKPASKEASRWLQQPGLAHFLSSRYHHIETLPLNVQPHFQTRPVGKSAPQSRTRNKYSTQPLSQISWHSSIRA